MDKINSPAVVIIVENLAILEKSTGIKIETAPAYLIPLLLQDLDNLSCALNAKKEITGPLNADLLFIRMALRFRETGGGASPRPQQ